MICAGGFYFFRGCGWPRRRYRYDPREIVRERYAKGELSKEEYEEIKKNLSHD
jgi:5-bromo-4-chloroindolyl phosphate hydrolysis protein